MNVVYSEEILRDLFARFLTRSCTEEDIRQLMEYAARDEYQAVWSEMLEQSGLEQSDNSGLNAQHSAVIDKVYTDILKAINPPRIRPVSVFYRNRFRVAAAVLIFLFGTGAYFWSRNSIKPTVSPVVKTSGNVVLPGKDGAILTLADGSVIVLDSLDNGVVAMQGNKQVMLKNGELSYPDEGKTAPGSGIAGVLYNTMTTPRGRQFEITLPDGTHVWLNAASSIRFPTTFTGGAREVEIAGEAYFEVAHNPKQPFRVYCAENLNGAGREGLIEVLGTHFNVNAYSDEAIICATLLEGKVKVLKGQDQVILQPNEQAQFSRQPNGRVEVKTNVDIARVMAWQKGMFEFNQADLPTIMRQISRWYNVDVDYRGATSQTKFGGGISKKLPLSDVLRMLESNGVKFKWEGNVLKVLP